MTEGLIEGLRSRINAASIQIQNLSEPCSKDSLERWLALCCELYNAGLQERRDAYRIAHKSIAYKDQQNQLPEIKAIRPELSMVHSQVLQDVLKRLDKAFDAFFRRVKLARKPAFRASALALDTIASPFLNPDSLSSTGKLKLSKIGKVKIKLHRPIEGKIKTLTITRTLRANGSPASL